MERDFFAVDEDEELGIDYHTSMGPEFFEPEKPVDEESTDADADSDEANSELGALSVSGSVSLGTKSGAHASAKAKYSPRRTTSRVKAVKTWLNWIRDHRATKMEVIRRRTKATKNLAAFFRIKLPPLPGPYHALNREDEAKLVKRAHDWLSAKLVPAPKPAPKPAPTPVRPVMPTMGGIKLPASTLAALAKLKLAGGAKPKIPVVRAPIPGMRAHVSPTKILLAKRGFSPGCACPEHHVVKDPEKRVVKLLAEAKVQREATSEHRGRMNDAQFRARVLRLLRRCVFGAQGRPENTVPGARMREKCLRTRVCT